MSDLFVKVELTRAAAGVGMWLEGKPPRLALYDIAFRAACPERFALLAAAYEYDRAMEVLVQAPSTILMPLLVEHAQVLARFAALGPDAPVEAVRAGIPDLASLSSDRWMRSVAFAGPRPAVVPGGLTVRELLATVPFPPASTGRVITHTTTLSNGFSRAPRMAG